MSPAAAIVSILTAAMDFELKHAGRFFSLAISIDLFFKGLCRPVAVATHVPQLTPRKSENTPKCSMVQFSEGNGRVDTKVSVSGKDRVVLSPGLSTRESRPGDETHDFSWKH